MLAGGAGATAALIAAAGYPAGMDPLGKPASESSAFVIPAEVYPMGTRLHVTKWQLMNFLGHSMLLWGYLSSGFLVLWR
jgi:hypothetical protein